MQKQITKREAQRKQLEREAKDFRATVHSFAAAAYERAARYYAKHHRSQHALERFMRRLET